MSTLGKILTVLVVLVSIAVAVLVARDFVFTENWKQLQKNTEANFNTALQQRDSALQQRNEEKRGRDQDKSLLQQQINTLTDELGLRNNTIAILNKEKDGQEKKLQELSVAMDGLDKSFKALLAEKDAWRGERDKATKEADDLRTMYSELDTKFRTAQADLSNLKETLRQTAEEKKGLESRLAYVAQNFPEVKFPAQVPAVPTEKMQGMVARVNADTRTVEINLGTDDGVVKGMKFFVYNAEQMKYLATLTVTMVSKDSAAGELSVIKGAVKVNDHVTNQFE